MVEDRPEELPLRPLDLRTAPRRQTGHYYCTALRDSRDLIL